MKRWRKRLTLFSLLAAGCLIWNLSGVGVKAEEAVSVPQVNLSFSDGSDISLNAISGVTLKADLSFEKMDDLTAGDFTQDSVWENNAQAFLTGTGNKKCITPGKIIVTLKPNQKSSVLSSTSVTPMISGQGNNISITSTNQGEIVAPMKSGAEMMFAYMWGTNQFVLRYGTYKNGIIQFLKWQDQTYVLNFPVEIRCSDYLDGGSDAQKFTFSKSTYNTNQNQNLNRYETSTMVSGNCTVDFENNLYKINLTSYNKAWSTVDTVYPQYAYGASGVDTTSVYYNGVEKHAFRSKQELVKNDSPFEFKIKNQKGEEEIFKVVINMPWTLKIDSQLNKYTPTVYVDNEVKNVTSFDDVDFNSDVRVAFSIPSGKKIVGIKAINGNSYSDIYSLDYEINGNSITFKMPKETLTITEIALEKFSTTERTITATPKVKDGTETDFAVIEKKVDDAIASTASEGKTVVLTAHEMSSKYKSFCGYKFDHWESDSITIPETEKINSTLRFSMPDHDVDVKAIYNRTGVSITAGISSPTAGNISLVNTGVGIASATSADNPKITELCRANQTYKITFGSINFDAYRFKGWIDEKGVAIAKEDANGIHWEDTTDADTGVAYYYPEITVTDQTQHMTFIASFEAKTACVLTFTSSDENKGTVSASVNGTSIISGNNTVFDEDSVTLKAEKKTGYKFAGWKVTSPADSGVTFEDATAEEITFTLPKIKTLTIQGVFEVDPEYLNPDCELTKVELLKQDGTLVKQANRSGITFTIRLSAEDMTAEEARNIASGGYLLRLTYPETATAAMEGGMKDGDSGAALWRTGISNSIGMGGSGTFTITAKRSEFKNTYTIAMEYDDRPVLKAGTVKRISDTEASVGFRSSSSGTYYWAVVDAGEAKPDIPTNVAGTTFKYADRENTIKLTSLTAGAKDIYIVVKNDNDSANVKISDVLKISIPAFGGTETTYKVNVTGNLPGGKVAVDKTEAKAGETVTVTVTPDSGKKMTANSLIYSQSSAPYEVVHIDEKTKQFTMPAYDLSVSCRFEDENSSTTPDATTTGKIGAFVVNGVSGTVDNTTGMITVTLPNGTDLTSLAPVITISGAKSISPASGATVDLSSPVTYTLTLEDGTTKTYTVRAYVEGPSKSDQLWNDMLNNVDGSPDHSGSKTWWKKAKDLKKHNDYPEYW